MDLGDVYMQNIYQNQQMQQTQATNIDERMQTLESELQTLKQKREEASSELQELTSTKNRHRLAQLAQKPWISWSEYQKAGVWSGARLTALDKQIDQNEQELEELKRVENEQLNSMVQDMSPAELQETLDQFYG